MKITAAPAAPTASREQTCGQCGASYRARRKSSRYCGNACRNRAHRGSAPVSVRSDPSKFTPVGKVLIHLNLAGLLSPTGRRSKDAKVYGLTVERAHALAEVQFTFDRKGWGYLSEEEFRDSLRADGLQGYSTDSPEGVDRKRLQARQRSATLRRAKASQESRKAA